jgi:hypothetical protein
MIIPNEAVFKCAPVIGMIDVDHWGIKDSDDPANKMTDKMNKIKTLIRSEPTTLLTKFADDVKEKFHVENRFSIYATNNNNSRKYYSEEFLQYRDRFNEDSLSTMILLGCINRYWLVYHLNIPLLFDKTFVSEQSFSGVNDSTIGTYTPKWAVFFKPTAGTLNELIYDINNSVGDIITNKEHMILDLRTDEQLTKTIPKFYEIVRTQPLNRFVLYYKNSPERIIADEPILPDDYLGMYITKTGKRKIDQIKDAYRHKLRIEKDPGKALIAELIEPATGTEGTDITPGTPNKFNGFLPLDGDQSTDPVPVKHIKYVATDVIDKYSIKPILNLKLNPVVYLYKLVEENKARVGKILNIPFTATLEDVLAAFTSISTFDSIMAFLGAKLVDLTNLLGTDLDEMIEILKNRKSHYSTSTSKVNAVFKNNFWFKDGKGNIHSIPIDRNVKSYLEHLGFLRFNTTNIRWIMWIILVQRMIFSQLRQQMEYYETNFNISGTELLNPDLFDEDL